MTHEQKGTVMMSAKIEIIFLSSSGSKILQRGSFPLKGKRPQDIAFDWWIKIQKEMFVELLEQVLCNGEEITDMIVEMEKKQ
jgi:hypothetical protein